MISSWRHSDDLAQSEDAKESQSRYHLHNHAFKHKTSSIRKMVTSSHNLDDRVFSRSNLSLMRSSSFGSSSTRNNRLLNFSLLGHDFTQATCSRYFGDCETCKRTVHSHKYAYCRNCPVVLHCTEKCISNLVRECPSLKIGVTGWGESQFQLTRDRDNLLNIHDIFLASNALLFNCPDCGREFTRGADNRVTETKKSKSKTADGKAEKKDKISLLKKIMVKFAKNQSSYVADSNTLFVSSPDHLGSSCSYANLDLEEVFPAMSRQQSSGSLVLQKNASKCTNHDVAARICHFTSRYFCKNCHWSNHWYIPGSIFVIHDVQKYPVSRSAYLLLRVLWDVALIDLPLEWITENALAKDMFLARRRLYQLDKFYSANCSIALDFRNRFISQRPRSLHLITDPLRMTMHEVIATLDGSLKQNILDIERSMLNHIAECSHCAGKMSSCYLCKNTADLFGDHIINCSQCSRPAHVQCVMKQQTQEDADRIRILLAFDTKCLECARQPSVEELHTISIIRPRFLL